MSMSIFATRGDTVRFVRPNAGYASDEKKVRKYNVQVGDLLTVSHTVVSRSSSIVYFLDFPGVLFNTVHFDDECIDKRAEAERVELYRKRGE